MPNYISDTSCLIVLDNIDMLFILKELYGNIFITQEVLKEFEKPIPDEEVLNKLKKAGFRISKELENEILKYEN